MRKGWFKIPGVQQGDRTLAEQLLGLSFALQEACSKTVGDLGCAEGLISLEFARAGAASVYGCDYNPELLETALDELERNPGLPVSYEFRDIAESISQGWKPQFDIVLALAVLHKLPDPSAGVKLCAEMARDLVVVRLPLGSTGVIRSKHYRHMRCNLPEEFMQHGFRRERKEIGPRGEWVQYWRRA